MFSQLLLSLVPCSLLLLCPAVAQNTVPTQPQQTVSPATQAQPESQQKPESKLDQLSTWMDEWHCEGKFAKGHQTITSTINFSPVPRGSSAKLMVVPLSRDLRDTSTSGLPVAWTR
jgi:hypothetical protein